MEMMNVEAAIRMLDNYVVLLEGGRKMVLQNGGKTNADPVIAAHFSSLQENFTKLLREATIDVIVLREEMTRQTPVLLNFPAELSKLLNALNTFDKEAEESGKAVVQTDPVESHPLPDNHPSSPNGP